LQFTGLLPGGNAADFAMPGFSSRMVWSEYRPETEQIVIQDFCEPSTLLIEKNAL